MSEDHTRVVGAASAGRQAAGGGVPGHGAGFGIAPGTLLANTYRFARLLGGGGMGEVYLAEHVGLGTRHAIKVIRPSMAVNRQVMDLFYREARVLRGVRHDAVVSYDGFIRDDAGRDYLVMEYVEGPSLAERLEAGPLPVQDVLALRDRLAAGLAEAHRRGAVHRDISPDNVILPGNDVAAAKLIDFGLSKLTDPTQESIVGSSFAGKYRYASPEQFGLFGGAIDARSDIYSLGLILAAAGLGRPLEMGDSFEATLQARRQLPDLQGVPEPLRPWLEAMLQPDPADRPPNMEALVRDWPAGDLLAGKSAAATVVRLRTAPRADVASNEDVSQPPSGSAGGRRRLVVAAALVAVLAVGGGLWWQLRPLPVDEPKPASQDQSTASVPSAPDHEPDASAADSADSALATLVQAGRLGEAFELVQQAVQARRAPPQEATWRLARALRADGQLDQAFALTRVLAGDGYGPATFVLAEMYDPLYWSATTSPLSKPNPDKALDWYRRAERLGVAEAGARIQALTDAEGKQ